MDMLLNEFFRVDYYYREALKINASFANNLDIPRAIVDKQIHYFTDDPTYHSDVLRQLDNLEQSKKDFDHSHALLLDSLRRHLRRLEVRIIQRDYENFDSKYWEDEELLNLNKMITPSFNQFIINKIMNYGEWQFAAIDINPLDGRWLRYMVSSDPLYVITNNSTVREACYNQFNDYYASQRLRNYTSLGQLPQYQLSLAIGVNLFEYMPLDPMKSWFKGIYRVLKPGGRFFFTYNDCEHRASLQLIDNEFRCYNTRTIMKSLAHGYGFDVLDCGHENGVWNWMEVKKPGKLHSDKKSGAFCELIKK